MELFLLRQMLPSALYFHSSLDILKRESINSCKYKNLKLSNFG